MAFHHVSNTTMGIILLSIVIILWVTSSLITSTILETYHYNKPFLITYLNISSFSFYLVPSLLKRFRSKPASTFPSDCENKLEYESETSSLLNSHDKRDTAMPLQKIIKLSGTFCLLWFMANFTTNSSLSFTSISSQTILSSTSSFFTLLISSFLHMEKINNLKIFGILISFCGIILLTNSDNSNNNNNNNTAISQNSILEIIFGDSLALLGALFYGIYSTLLKYSLQKNETRQQRQQQSKQITEKTNSFDIKLFFGFVGLITLTCLWPILIILNYFQIETLQLPNSNQLILLIILNCSINFISDFCWAKSIILTNPLIVTMGLSFTIPLAMFVDFMFINSSNSNSNYSSMNINYIIGAILVMVSFLLINSSSCSTSSEEEEQQQQLNDTNQTIQQHDYEKKNHYFYNSI
ncbi:uncharacterized protein NDAI_0H01730 [Naumovozyma dairenensis CBS 421]|uniref:EamA domain-containing protein n=1 Tax=Naumovozyma dairenensis (strain ATCC 10597 / BCRC 20456 / CBS 421 / NBRC 0211 / NRRL Y-12639) TaxID=1071378 RepID=G0WEY6_NAUDC|nr:hypothetical protein NDAI_0H01730 [Naumovozyma dairenensis CBS 421]CCD26347.1 hypothetical protein NDAI_0H01730 [Naumovozyma dairenensis CBS 421]